MSALFAGLAAALRTGADTMQWNWRARRVEEVEERRAKHEEKALIRKEARVKAATIAAETRKEAAMQRKIDKGWVELPGAARYLDENVAEAARIQADELAGARQKILFGLRNKARVDAASLLRKQKTTDAKTLRGQKLDDAELLRQQKLDDAKAKRELADQKAKDKKLEEEVKGYGTVRGVKNTQYFNQAMAEKRLYLSITDKGYQKKEILHTFIDGEKVTLSGEDPRYMDELDKHAFRRTFEGYSPETQALMAAKKWRGSEDWMTPEEAAEAAKTDLERWRGSPASSSPPRAGRSLQAANVSPGSAWRSSKREASQGEAAAPAAAPAPEAAPEAAPGGDPAAVTDVPDGDVFFDLSRGARRSYLKALGRGTLLRIRGELYRVDANGDIYRVDANGDMYKVGSR